MTTTINFLIHLGRRFGGANENRNFRSANLKFL